MADTNQAGGDNAQSPDASNEGSQSSQSHSGLEARIGELTAGMRDAQRDAIATRELLAAQQAEVQRLQGLLAAPKVDQPGVDYSQLGDAGQVVKQAVEDAVTRTKNELTAQFQSQFKQLQSVQVQSQVASIAAQYGLSAELAAQAQSVMVGATQRGIPMVPEDAVKWALGEAMMAGKYQPPSGPTARKPGPNGNVLIGAAPVPQPQHQRVVAMPANFDSYSPDQQHEWLSKNGMLDMPLD
jgi:hypothetical protein